MNYFAKKGLFQLLKYLLLISVLYFCKLNITDVWLQLVEQKSFAGITRGSDNYCKVFSLLYYLL